MGVRFRVVLNDGVSIGRSHICFGTLNCLPWSSDRVVDDLTPVVDQALAREFLDSTCSEREGPQQQHFSYIEYLPDTQFMWQAWSAEVPGTYVADKTQLSGETIEEAKERSMLAYFDEMHELAKDVDEFKDIVTVNHLHKGVRVHVKEHSADKVMMALFMFRNMAQYDYARGYLKLREMGYRPRVAFIVASMFHCRASNAFGRGGWSGQSEGEASFVRPETFGMQAMVNWFKQEFEEDLWQQAIFIDQQGGYKRDDRLKEEGEIFYSGAEDAGPSEDADEDWDDEDDHGFAYYRHMSDTFCIPGDDSICPDHVRWNDSDGFQFHTLANKDDAFITEIIERAATAANIPSKLETE